MYVGFLWKTEHKVLEKNCCNIAGDKKLSKWKWMKVEGNEREKNAFSNNNSVESQFPLLSQL